MKSIRRLALPLAVLAVASWSAPEALAYRAVYNGSFIENGQQVGNLNEDNQLHDEILWLAGSGAAFPVRACVLEGIGTDAFWFAALWQAYASRHPGQVVVIRAPARPVTQAYLEGLSCDVAVISNAWHGPPAVVPPPSPGGGDWAYRMSEGDEILAWLDANDAGLLATAGTFGQFAFSGPDSNYKTFSAMMGVQATAGGGPGCDPAFPWSRNSGCYPATRTASTHLVDVIHPIVSLPLPVSGAYALSFTTAAAVWMGTAGAVPVARVIVGGPEPSLTTAFESQRPIEVTEFRCHDGIFKGHPTTCWVTAKNVSGMDLDVDVGSLLLAGDATSWALETLQFSRDDANGVPGLDPDGEARWATVLTLPLGPPDNTYAVSARVCSAVGCGSGTFRLTSDSCKKNTAAPGDEMDAYRHFQQAVLFLRTAWRNGDPRVPQALQLLALDTDDGFKDAHTLLSNTSPGPGAYNLELIHENLDEGNCQFGVTGAWLKGL